MLAVKVDTVLDWIHRGELAAINVAKRMSPGRSWDGTETAFVGRSFNPKISEIELKNLGIGAIRWDSLGKLRPAFFTWRGDGWSILE